jgi:steroid 5-alpha reductase family enzyme
MLIVWIIGLAIGLAAAMAVAWAIVIRTGKSGWADAIWSYAIGVASLLAALLPLGNGFHPSARAWIIAVIVAVWSLRLGTHILRRTLSGGDDPRYAQLRSEWGANYRGRLLMFLEIQAAAALLLAVSVMAAANNPAPFGALDGLGVVIAIVAIGGEAVSDAQLRAFTRYPANKDKVCDSGLWSLSRHPNYFFEWLIWIAYLVMAIGYWPGLVALAAPILMYLLLVHVSGIPPLEAHMMRSRPAAFAAYKRRVRAFWPIPNTSETAQ